ncbi:MAG: acyloxyacyl hydrolase [Gammaproteobacteria bacterium]|nr:acyloxyacyl hydrolase [Gammaproteobacteria bacterium]
MVSLDVARAAVRSLCFGRPRQVSLVLLVGGLLLTGGVVQAAQPIESFVWKAAVATTAVLIATTNPLEADGMLAEVGGGDHINVVRIGARWDWKEDLLDVFGWKVDTYWQLEFSKWQSTRDASQDGSSVTAGLIPVFRFVGKQNRFRPYIDVGVGVNVFSVSRLEDHQFGSNFQFSDVFGFGVHFGNRNQWELGYKFQHYSNGSVRVPNKGINFSFLTLSYMYK